MGYSFPPLVVNVTVNTNAVANTNTTHTLLAAPGAGKAYRIVGYRVAGVPAGTGNVRSELQGAGVTGSIAHMQYPPGGSDDWHAPDPGVQLAANEALQEIDSSNVVSQNLRMIVYYYLDTV